MRKDTPCRECTERYVGCHAKCEKYINWSTEHIEEKKKITEGRYREYMAENFLIKRREARKKLRNRRGEK